MSIYNYNIDFLRLQDNSLVVESIKESNINGVFNLVVSVKKDAKEKCCAECGSINIVVNSYYTRTIKYLDVAGYNCIIKYKQKRYMCKDCNITFNEKCNFVEKNSTISNATKVKLLEECRIKQSFKDVSQRLNVSHTTVLNEFKEHISFSRNKLTEILCFDEFKATNGTIKYAFILADPLSGEIVDILPSRQQEYLYDYFNKVSDEERFGVKYIVTDLFESYRSVIRNRFWKSIHIADRFHWVRLATDAYNRMRIKAMNSYKSLGEDRFKGKYNKYTTYYYLLKNYAKILLINRYSREKSFFERTNYVYHLDKELTLNEIIEHIINKDGDLEEGYFLLQDLYKIAKQSTYDTAKHDLLEWIDRVNNYNSTANSFKSVADTYKTWLNEIVNSFIINPKTHKRMSNGFIEGKNNYIKVIKRIGFGFKNFETFRAKILYTNSKNKLPYKY
ncbi:MAG: ISL3 family transposase [Bacilli bacterium]|nr:ISL3 family transposase [Bacilli bacterium]